jgi:hypothetical protein
LQEDLESLNEPRICTDVVDFALKGDGELTVTGYALRLGGQSTTPSSIIFVELSIIESSCCCKVEKIALTLN